MQHIKDVTNELREKVHEEANVLALKLVQELAETDVTLGIAAEALYMAHDLVTELKYNTVQLREAYFQENPLLPVQIELELKRASDLAATKSDAGEGAD